MRRLVPLLALALSGLAGCSNRERANPFDLRNPLTRGAPSGFVALAGNGRVDLRWDYVASDELAGYRLYRKTAADTSFRALTSVLRPTTTGFADLGLLNGLDHAYRLVFVFQQGGERGEVAEDTATPGAARPWVADPGSGKLLRIAPDGRHVAFELAGLEGSSAVGVDSAAGLVWVSDNAAGKVLVLDPATGVTVTIPGLVSPGTLAVEPLGHSAWICDERDRTLYQFSANGAPVGAPIEPIEFPIGLAIDPTDRSVWVCERGANRVRRYNTAHTLVGGVTVDRPSRVAVDSLSRRAWVTSFETGRLFKISPSDSIERLVTGFAGPIGVAVDARRGRIWVADALGDRIVALDRSGNITLRVTGLSEVRDLSVDAESGDVWAVVPGSGEVVRINVGGLVVRRLAGLGRPFGVSVDPGVR